MDVVTSYKGDCCRNEQKNKNINVETWKNISESAAATVFKSSTVPHENKWTKFTVKVELQNWKERACDASGPLIFTLLSERRPERITLRLVYYRYGLTKRTSQINVAGKG